MGDTETSPDYMVRLIIKVRNKKKPKLQNTINNY